MGVWLGGVVFFVGGCWVCLFGFEDGRGGLVECSVVWFILRYLVGVGLIPGIYWGLGLYLVVTGG